VTDVALRLGRAACLAVALSPAVLACGASPATAAPAVERSARSAPTIVPVGPAVAGKPAVLALRMSRRGRRAVRRYAVTFGDGTRAARGRRPPRRIRHTFRTAGRYTVRITLVGADGRRTRISRRIRVSAAATRPGPGIPGPPPSQQPAGSASQTGPPALEPVLAVKGDGMSVVQGSSVTTPLPAPLVSVGSVAEAAATSAGLSGAVRDGALRIDAAATAPAGPGTVALEGTGCTESACNRRFTLDVPVTVRSLAAPDGDLDALTTPSEARVAAAADLGDGARELRDEIVITLGTPDAVGTRSDAEAVAAAVGGAVSGGLADLGVYEIRWVSAQDLDAVSAVLEARPGVTAVSRRTIGLLGPDAVPPGDWDDDGPQVIWPFTQVRAQQAWDTTTGSGVKVGVVDSGTAFADHEDLDVVTQIGAVDGNHATHVAGTACARANGIGLVGMAWGCPVVSAGIADSSPSSVLSAAERVAKTPGVRVVNLSLGYKYGRFCHTAQQQDELRETFADPWRRSFRNLFQGPVGRGIVWTISAGNNCAEDTTSPWGENADLPNVITVAATNDDGRLASFSDFGPGIEVAAPGGVSAGDAGIWSTTYQGGCGFLGLKRCSSYGRDYGTSMAAPAVAGIAALVRSAHLDYGAVEAAACITQTAGDTVGIVHERSDRPDPVAFDPKVDYPADSLPIVNAEAAVECDVFDSSSASSYVGSWTSSDWLLDMAEEAPGTLGAVNQQGTFYTDTCTLPAGTKIISGLTLAGGGEWHGDILTANVTACVPSFFAPVLTMRSVKENGTIYVRLAWATHAGGARPSIDEQGTVTSSTPFYSMWLTQPGRGLAADLRRRERTAAATGLSLPRGTAPRPPPGPEPR
jgi:hypothetical protein